MWQPACNSTAGMVSWEKAGESGWTRWASTGVGEVQEKLFQVGEERDKGAQLSYNTQLSICEALNFIPRPKQIWLGRGGKEDILWPTINTQRCDNKMTCPRNNRAPNGAKPDSNRREQIPSTSNWRFQNGHKTEGTEWNRSLTRAKQT